MDKKRSSLGLNPSSKKKKTAENEATSGFHSPASNKRINLYKSVLKDSVGKSTSSTHSKVRFSLSDSIKESPRERKTSGEFDFHCSFDSDEENNPNNSFSCTQPVSQDAILQGVVAYIDARSNTENRFEGISKQMELLGAVVVKKFIPEVTHVIFKDGKKSTRQKALKKGIHLVNVLWVESCRQSGKRVPEDLFPVVPDEVHTPLVTGKLKRTKSMQPRSFEDDIRNSAERIHRKRQRKVAAEKTPTSILSPLTLRLLSEDSQAPASPLVNSSKYVPDTPGCSTFNSPDHQDEDSKETALTSKRLNFVDTPAGSPSLPPTKTPVSPKTIPTDILQTASGPGKKRKRVQSSRESTSNEPDENPKLNKKTKPTSSPSNNTDVFTFDQEELKTSKLKRARKLKSKSTSSAESKIEKSYSSGICEDELENHLQANNIVKKSKGKTQEDAILNYIPTPSSTSGKDSSSRDVERDLENLVCATGFSDSGVSFSETEIQEKNSKLLKKRKREFKKTQKMVGEIVSTDDEKELEDFGIKTSEQMKLVKRTESVEKIKSEAKRRKKCTPKKNNETGKNKVMPDEKGHSLTTDVCETKENDENKNNNVKKVRPQKEKKKRMISEESDNDVDDVDVFDDDDDDDDDNDGNGKEKNESWKKMYTRKIIPEESDDDDDDIVDNDDGSGRGKNDSRRKACRKAIPKGTNNENDVDDTNDSNDGDDDHVKKISRKNKSRKTLPDDADDDNVSGECMTGDEIEISEGQYGRENLTHTPKDKQKQKDKTRKKPTRSLVLTSMHFSEQDIVISVVRKLGGFFIADTVGPSTTHVISGSPRRTLNVLMAIAQGNWLVSPEWIMKSLETGYWVDEEPYELADAFPSAQLSRLERVSSGPDYHQELLADVDSIFVADSTSPPRDKLIQLITLCGGKICTSIRKADVIVGNSSRKTKAINVSERWVLDSITEHTALSFNPYVLNPTKSTSPTF